MAPEFAPASAFGFVFDLRAYALTQPLLLLLPLLLQLLMPWPWPLLLPAPAFTPGLVVAPVQPLLLPLPLLLPAACCLLLAAGMAAGFWLLAAGCW